MARVEERRVYRFELEREEMLVVQEAVRRLLEDDGLQHARTPATLNVAHALAEATR